MTGMVAYVLSRKLLADTAQGLGIVKGAPCTIKSIVPFTDPTGRTGNTVTFEWTANDGVTKQTKTMNVMDGMTIDDIQIDANNHLIFTLSDGTTIDSGELPGGASNDHWYGEKSVWDNLPLSEKQKFLYIHFTDDPASGFMVVSEVAQLNDHNPISSHGVAEAIANFTSTFIGSESDWSNETSKTDYKLCIITDD